MLTRSQMAVVLGLALLAGFAIASMSGCMVISRAPELRACQQDRSQWVEAAQRCGNALQQVNPLLEKCLEVKKKHPDEWQTDSVDL